MSPAGALAWAAQASTIVLAIILARRRVQHRPFAVWAGVCLAADLTSYFVLAPRLQTPGPYHGAQRVVFHLDQAGFLVPVVGLAMLGWIVFLARRPWVPLAVGVASWLALVVGYPHPFRGATLGAAYAVLQAVAIIATIGAFLSWMRRRAHVRPEHAAVLFAASICISLFAGPYAPTVGDALQGLALPEPWRDWSSAEVLLACMWSGLLAMHVASLWTGLWLEPAPPRGGLRTH